MTAVPDNADEAYFLTANWAKTLDGGKTILDPPFKEVPAGDHHDVWVDPTNGHRMIVSHDGGVSITENRDGTATLVALAMTDDSKFVRREDIRHALARFIEVVGAKDRVGAERSDSPILTRR